MTDRLKGCVVVFERDIREDDAEAILHAIRMIKGIAEVEPNVSDADDYINQRRVLREVQEKLFEFTRDLDFQRHLRM